MKTYLLATVVTCLGFSVSVNANDMPKEFDFTVTFTWASTDHTLELGEKNKGTTWQGKFAASNDAGDVFMHNMFGECIGLNLNIASNGENRGACVYTDMDGDKLYETFQRAGDKREITFIGGTGKFAGIECSGEFKGVGWNADFSQGLGKKIGSCRFP